jgi:hypothetical protein
MNKRTLLTGSWFVVAAVLSLMAILDIMRWKADPEFVRLGLTWADSYLPHAVVAGVTAAACLSTHRVGLWIAVASSTLFGLYFAAYLVFGGEGALVVRVLAPLALLCLTGMTIRYAIRNLRAQAQMPPTSAT